MFPFTSDPKVREVKRGRLLVVSEETLDADIRRYADGGFDGVSCTADLLRHFPGDPFADVTVRHDRDRQALLARSDLTRLLVGGPNDSWVPLDLAGFGHLIELGIRMHKKTVLPRSFPHLQHLHIDRYAPVSPETSLPPELPSLRTLVLSPAGPSESMPVLPHAPRLDYFEYHYSRVTSLDGLDPVRTVRELQVYQQSRLTDISAIARLEFLEAAAFDTCRRLTDFSALGSCRKLRRLSIVNSPRVQSIAFLRDCAAMEWFHTGGTDIIDGDLTPLIGVREVRMAQYRRHYSHTEAQLRELTARRARGESVPAAPTPKPAQGLPAGQALLPTTEWLENPEATQFPADGVRLLHERLGLFVRTISTLRKNTSRRLVLDLVKALVLEIGGIHESHGSFLDSTAREQLVDFIHDAVADFDVSDADDITEQWRRW